MIFSSFAFICVYLPIVFTIYFVLNKLRFVCAGKYWLVVASLFFYGYWSYRYIPLLLVSIFFNYFLGRWVSPSAVNEISSRVRKPLLGLGVALNLLVLAYYKYVNFFIDNLNHIAGSSFSVGDVILPLGISFYTFTQIAFLVDSYRGQAKEYKFVNYSLFVTFFPHLIAGPILHHKEMMEQFSSKWTLAIRYRNILMGLFIFSIGFFKKVIIADNFALVANAGFGSDVSHDLFSAWATSLSYTFQIYFDFSGYCDMAIGAALLFNIWLPVNFNSPYKSLDIQEFWRRWHMTLSRYLRDYLYIPLGGNRCAPARMYFNLMITFILGGLWHGASWMFVAWGALHGGALVIHRVWKNLGMSLPNPLAWLITFLFINVTWVFFRADSIKSAKNILFGMVNFGSIQALHTADVPTQNIAWGGVNLDYILDYLPAGLASNLIGFAMILFAFIIIAQKNSYDFMTESRISWKKTAWMAILFCVAMYSTVQSTSTIFLYFNF